VATAAFRFFVQLRRPPLVPVSGPRRVSAHVRPERLRRTCGDHPWIEPPLGVLGPFTPIESMSTTSNAPAALTRVAAIG
jgi:hypothetical protein